MLNKDQILNVPDLKIKKVSVPEWNGDVFVRRLSGTEKDALGQSVVEGEGADAKVNLKNATAKLCAWTICDEKGVLLFSAKDADELGKKSSKALKRIYDVSAKLSGLDIDDLAKN